MKTEINIPSNKIISSTDLIRNYKEMSIKIDSDGMDFIFKNNKPDKVIMTYDKFIEFIDLIEHSEIYSIVKKSDEEDTGKNYTLEEALKILDENRKIL